jgi:Arm DNA-binding domain
MPEAIPFPSPAARLERRRILNDTTIRSLKPPATGRVDYFDDLTPGLSLRVTSKNARSWTVFYRNKNGRQKRLTLGRYPAVKLVDARELARETQRKVAHGGDPVVETRAARDVLTFGALAKEYIDSYAKPNKRSWQEDERQLNASLLPRWKTRPAAEISAEELLAVLNAKVGAGAPWLCDADHRRLRDRSHTQVPPSPANPKHHEKQSGGVVTNPPPPLPIM